MLELTTNCRFGFLDPIAKINKQIAIYVHEHDQMPNYYNVLLEYDLYNNAHLPTHYPLIDFSMPNIILMSSIIL